MKKIMFIGVFLTLSIFCNAQEILADKVDSKDTRIIIAGEMLCSGLNNVETKISMTYAQNEKYNIKMWHIYIRFVDVKSNLIIPKDAVLLIKLTNNKVIELKASEEQQFNIENNSLNANYEIKRKDLIKIAKFGVKKIRIEFYQTILDEEYEGNEIGEAIKILYELLSNRLAENPNKTIWSDF